MTDEELRNQAWNQVRPRGAGLFMHRRYRNYLPPDFGLRSTVDEYVENKIGENINPILGTLVAHYWSIETNEVDNKL
jgi:hypothetical protein